MKSIGNENANRFWEATATDVDRIDSHADMLVCGFNSLALSVFYVCSALSTVIGFFM
jgi:hypothetical protein